MQIAFAFFVYIVATKQNGVNHCFLSIFIYWFSVKL